MIDHIGLSVLDYEPAKAFYNQACALVRLGDPEEALVRLGLARELGLDVVSYAAADPDLEPLRSHRGLAAMRD